MPENDLLRRYLDAGVAFTQLTRQRAESIVKDLVRTGEVSREQAATRVEELLDRSRQSTEAVVAIVRKEIDDRVSQLNLVTRDELASLAGRLGLPVSGATKAAKSAAGKATSTTKKAAATATGAARKATGTATKAAAAKKAPAKKAPAKKATAVKKAPAKKATAAKKD
jgi:polyhydroxyalkanoate synthesis regulator phasin